MTMPHLMNCDHSETGWCLACVKALWEERNGTRDVREIRCALAMFSRVLKSRDDILTATTEDMPAELRLLHRVFKFDAQGESELAIYEEALMWVLNEKPAWLTQPLRIEELLEKFGVK